MSATVDAPESPPPPGRRPALPSRREFLALFTAVMLPMFLASVDQTVLATATPSIAAELGGLADTAWISVGYLLAATVMAPLYGRLGDRYGRRRLLLAALGVFSLGSLACGLAVSLMMLVAARVLQGLGGGGLMVMSQSLIGELVPPMHRPRFQSYFAIVFTASSIGGPVIGGFVVNHLDWRWLFLVNLPLCALAAWRVNRLPTAPGFEVRRAPFDGWGVLLFAVTACSLLLWLSLSGHHFGWLSAPSAALLVLALAGAGLLRRQQSRHVAPFLPLDILRLPGVGWICVTVLSFAGSLFALIFLLPIYLQLGHGASAAGAGLQLLPLTAGTVLGTTVYGRITMRTGRPTQLTRFALALSAAALATMALASPSTATISVCAALCGLGLGTVMPAAQLSVQMLAGQRRLGAAAALLSLSRSLGAALGTAAFGGLVFALLRAAPGASGDDGLSALGRLPPHEVTQAFHLVFGAVAAFIALGAWAATRVPALRLDAGDAPEPSPTH